MAQERNEPERVHGLRGYKEESEEIKVDKSSKYRIPERRELQTEHSRDLKVSPWIIGWTMISRCTIENNLGLGKEMHGKIKGNNSLSSHRAEKIHAIPTNHSGNTNNSQGIKQSTEKTFATIVG